MSTRVEQLPTNNPPRYFYKKWGMGNMQMIDSEWDKGIWPCIGREHALGNYFELS